MRLRQGRGTRFCGWDRSAGLAVLVIAGSGRGAGKTAVGCALMAAMPEFRWVAVKVSPHLHDVAEGLWEELNLRSDKDTGRYLSAGAKQAFLISGVTDSQITELIAEGRNRAAECDALLVESNRTSAGAVSHRGERAVTVAVLSGAATEWKTSLRECMGSVDALVLANGLRPEELDASFPPTPVFGLAPGQWFMPELLTFVRERLAG